MIVSFGDKATEDLYHGVRTKRVRRIPRDMWKTARRKLDMVQYAHVLRDLRVPPANRLEALRGNLQGYHSIRINDQWRLIFQWTKGGAHDVSIVDYHAG